MIKKNKNIILPSIISLIIAAISGTNFYYQNYSNKNNYTKIINNNIGPKFTKNDLTDIDINNFPITDEIDVMDQENLELKTGIEDDGPMNRKSIDIDYKYDSLFFNKFFNYIKENNYILSENDNQLFLLILRAIKLYQPENESTIDEYEKMILNKSITEEATRKIKFIILMGLNQYYLFKHEKFIDLLLSNVIGLYQIKENFIKNIFDLFLEYKIDHTQLYILEAFYCKLKEIGQDPAEIKRFAEILNSYFEILDPKLIRKSKHSDIKYIKKTFNKIIQNKQLCLQMALLTLINAIDIFNRPLSTYILPNKSEIQNKIIDLYNRFDSTSSNQPKALKKLLFYEEIESLYFKFNFYLLLNGNRVLFTISDVNEIKKDLLRMANIIETEINNNNLFLYIMGNEFIILESNTLTKEKTKLIYNDKIREYSKKIELSSKEIKELISDLKNTIQDIRPIPSAPGESETSSNLPQEIIDEAYKKKLEISQNPFDDLLMEIDESSTEISREKEINTTDQKILDKLKSKNNELSSLLEITNKYIREIKKELNKKDEIIKESMNVLEELKSKLNIKEIQIYDVTESFRDSYDNLMKLFNKKEVEYKGEISRLTSQLSSKNIEIQNIKEKTIKEIDKKNEIDKTKYHEILMENMKYRDKIEKLNDEIQKLTIDLNKNIRTIVELRNENEEIKNKRAMDFLFSGNKKDEKIEKLNSELSKKDDIICGLQTKIDELQSQIEKFTKINTEEENILTSYVQYMEDGDEMK